MKLITWLVVVALVLVGCQPQPAATTTSAVPFFVHAGAGPQWSRPAGSGPLSRVSFQLFDQRGRRVDQDKRRGRVVVVNFFFTSCSCACPILMQNLKRVHEQFKHDARVEIWSHSMQPSVDTVDTLAAYAKELGCQHGTWKLLTGDSTEMTHLARWVYVPPGGVPADEKRFLHSERVLLYDPRGHLRGVYNGNLSRDISLLNQDIGNILREER